MSRSHKIFFLGAPLLLLAANANAWELEATGMTHVSYCRIQADTFAGIDLGLRLNAVFWEDLGFGVETVYVTPATGSGSAPTLSGFFQAIPFTSIRLGEDNAVSLFRLGLGPQFASEPGKPSAWMAMASAGVRISPRELPFSFGFELRGCKNISGLDTLSIGLGGTIGFLW